MVSAVAIGAALIAPHPLPMAVACWIAASFALAAAAYAGVGPRLLGKRADGSLPWWSYAVHGPFLLLGLVSMRMVHATQPNAPFHEVAPGLVLGRRPTHADRSTFAALKVTSVLDLCAELPRSAILEGRRYLTLPVLDAEAPTQAQLAEAVRWLDDVMVAGPVLVHCALGYGRSATIVGAWLLSRGAEGDALDVEMRLRRMRAGVRFTEPQLAALEVFRREKEAR